jgi:phytoene dehydrogenase-like protein
MIRKGAPVEDSFGEWLGRRHGADSAQAASGLAGPLTFDADPARLSARFVQDRIKRILMHQPPVARYPVGGWSALVDRLATYARAVGVNIHTASRVGSLDDLEHGPVIVAVEPSAARRFLGDLLPRAENRGVVYLDVGLVRRRGDPYIVFDLDEAGFVANYSAVVPGLAPQGHELVQAMVGLRLGEELGDGEARVARLLDAAFPDWQERTVWQRRAIVRESTGAVDLPGTTWQDRTPVAFREGVWLVGDWVAAPGHLAEVSCTSAISAAAAAIQAT